MGVLTDLILAEPSEAGAIRLAEGAHVERWPTLQLKGLDPIKLTTLWRIVDPNCVGEGCEDLPPPSPPARQRSWFSWLRKPAVPAGNDDTDDPPILRVRDEFVARLAALTEVEVESAITKFQKDQAGEKWGWTPEDCDGVFRELVIFARRAVAEGKPMLLWICV